MEHKIGEIVILPDGRKAEVVEIDRNWCKGCLFYEDCGELDCSILIGML